MKTLLLIMVSLFASFSYAKQYGEGGCGLGLELLGKNGNQVLAATTNSSSFTQAFGISSGTSGCTDGGAIASDKQVPAYIEMNRTSLAVDSSRGQGETLAGLAQLVGCDAKNFGPAMKANYNKIFVDTNMEPSAIEQNVRSLISNNKAQTCGT